MKSFEQPVNLPIETPNNITSHQPKIRNWLLISLFNLLIAVGIGALLRLAFLIELPWMEFRNWLHAHSHLAMLGWVYLALYALFIAVFLNQQQQRKDFYKKLFIATQLTVVGMLLAFPVVGYDTPSIAFSSLHVIFSYLFTSRFLKDLKAVDQCHLTSLKYVKTALFFMILSTLALWSMAPIMALGYKHTSLYHIAVQFYLHFQFNGWFIFGLLGLFFKIMESRNIKFPKQTEIIFYKLLVISCFLTFALAVTWTNPVDFIFWINGVGVLLQFVAMVYFIIVIKEIYQQIAALFNSTLKFLFQLSLLSFLLKMLIQTIVFIPYIATIAYTVRNFVIGFIHLMLLGVVTTFLLAFGGYLKILFFKNTFAKIGILFFITGLILSEGILFLQGLLLWQAMGFLPFYYEGIFGVSVLMPLGIACFGIGQINVFGNKNGQSMALED